jgi:hypothetical protein
LELISSIFENSYDLLSENLIISIVEELCKLLKNETIQYMSSVLKVYYKLVFKIIKLQVKKNIYPNKILLLIICQICQTVNIQTFLKESDEIMKLILKNNNYEIRCIQILCDILNNSGKNFYYNFKKR